MTNFNIQDAVIKKVHSLIAKFEKKFGTNLKQTPVIKFTKKGRVAGTFSWGGKNDVWCLNFNMVLLKENFSDFLNSTVPHEVAHLLVHNIYGVIRSRNGNMVHHGKDWKLMMSFLGTDAKRCHSYNIKNVGTKKRKTWSYTCNCGTDHQLSTIRHNRIVRGQTSYLCKKCKGEIVKA